MRSLYLFVCITLAFTAIAKPVSEDGDDSYMTDNVLSSDSQASSTLKVESTSDDIIAQEVSCNTQGYTDPSTELDPPKSLVTREFPNAGNQAGSVKAKPRMCTPSSRSRQPPSSSTEKVPGREYDHPEHPDQWNGKCSDPSRDAYCCSGDFDPELRTVDACVPYSPEHPICASPSQIPDWQYCCKGIGLGIRIPRGVGIDCVRGWP